MAPLPDGTQLRGMGRTWRASRSCLPAIPLAMAMGCYPDVADEPAAGLASAAPGVAAVRQSCPDEGTCASRLGPGHHRGLKVWQSPLPRIFDLYIPRSQSVEQPPPLLFVLHPLTQNREWGKLAAGMIAKSEQEGFIAVFPDGILGSWNGGTCCGAASLHDLDDVGVIRAIHGRVGELVSFDRSRVYATGLSNGAFLSHRLGCEAADIITAIAPVAGVLGIPPEQCAPSRPVPVLQIHGTDDALVPYLGGSLGRSAQDTVAAWASRNGCTGPITETLRRGSASCSSYRDCDEEAQVTLCTIEGGGHCWFGEPLCFVGGNPNDLPATDAVWEFLRRFRI
jgi:polyhydroxybutyrate depolymerase